MLPLRPLRLSLLPNRPRRLRNPTISLSPIRRGLGRSGQYDTPYKFNGKEKDEETGYNNYGARYYYDWASIWLSVDPMSDKYPHLTSYNYCANNPVMLVDPDGRKIVLHGTDETYEPGKKSNDKRVQALNEIYKTKEGKDIIDKLHSADEIYSIKEKGDVSTEDAIGAVVPKYGDDFNLTHYEIEWGGVDNGVDGGTSENSLAEEIFHCFQKYDINGKYTGKEYNYTIGEEVDAKMFSGRMFSRYEKYFQRDMGIWQETTMGVMNNPNYSKSEKGSYLQGIFRTIGYTENPKYNPKAPQFHEKLRIKGAY